MENFETGQYPKVEIYIPQTHAWEMVWPDIEKLEDECFPGKGMDEGYMRNLFEDTENIIVTVKLSGKIIGFTCGIPDKDTPGALYIETTEISPEHQGKRLVVELMKQLEHEAKTRGYSYITRDAEIANGYADKIEKNYGDRITERSDHESEYSMGGWQRYFKIEL